MQHNTLLPRQALNKAYLRLKTARHDMERFKAALSTLLDSINPHETEEHAKNHLRDFLKAAFYSGYGINTKGRTDLVIHTGLTTKSSAGVLLEVKRPGNRADMPTTQNLNYKAVHELLLYYLQERVLHKNNDLRHLIVTDVHEWFVFDALEFDRLFYRNSQLRKDFADWSEGRKSGSSTEFFYREIAAPAIAQLSEGITYTYFDLRDYEKPLRNRDLKDDVKLVQLYKLFSPPHLLKVAFANDANSLDTGFYLELLHIIGLEEVKEGGRKLIRRKAKPNSGSLLEAAYQKLRSEDLIGSLDNPYAFGNTREEQLFNVALELSITWMNRVLFLKLLEAQLISYHLGDRRYAFMSSEHLREFDDLNELFFDVLAERPHLRTDNVRHKFAHIPYLNSSLFETTALEKRTLRISNLKDRTLLPVYPHTVLRDQQGKSLGKSQTELPTLAYLLRFLGSYDFGAEGKEAIQEENKTLITASVLGLIFEKINGYRDGSFYTPGFITMYMSREAIRRAVVQRFNEALGWETASFEALQFQLNRRYSPEVVLEGNNILNSLRICDPAVGSGHYLVSALNELLVIKWELGLLLNRKGKPLRAGSIEVQNDELIITDTYGELFSYTVHQQPDGSRSINPQVQEIQETLFHEKQTIIENCLFGVDINPNSVKICRLRLWIELLKHAYYCLNQDLQDFRINRISQTRNFSKPSGFDSDNFSKNESWKSVGVGALFNPENPGGRGPREDSDNSSPVCYADTPGMREGFGAGIAEGGQGRYSDLQTLPNIDINIKQGNSLLSRYPLTADLQEAFGRKGHSLPAYREAVAGYKQTRSKEQKKELERFLEELRQGFRTTLANNDPLRQRMAKLRGQISVMQDPDLFGTAKIDKTKLAKLKKELQKLEDEREQIETNKVYEGAFEWRFEFPEVLDEQGNYRGFDVVIGNPPYIRQEELGSFKLYLKKHFATYAGTADLYVYFVERGIDLLREGGQFSYIVPNKWMRAGYGQALRGWVQSYTLQQLLDFGDLPVFEEATTYPLIVSVTKTKPEQEDYTLQAAGIDTLNFEHGLTEYLQNNGYWVQANLLPDSGWSLSDSTAQQLLEKLKNTGIPLGEYVEGKIYYGIKTGYNEAFVIDEATKDRLIAEDPKSAEVIKPFLAGRDVKRYMPPKSDKYLIFTRRGIDIEAYPAILNYLSNYQERLMPKPKDWSGKSWSGRKEGSYKWYEIQDNVAYFSEFEKPKIMLPDISLRGNYTLDEEGNYYLVNTAYIIGNNDKFLLGLLASQLLHFFYLNLTSSIRGGYLRFIYQYLIQLPIAQADEETKAGIRTLVEQVLAAKQADAAADTSALEAEIDLQVYRLYHLTYDEVLLVDPAFALPREAYEAVLYLKEN